MNLTNLILLANESATSTDTGSAFVMSFLPMIIVLIMFYFFLIRPQNKKEKETKAMRESIQIGDEICTIGGIVGIVVRQTEDTVVIETGGERNKLRIKKWAIQENLTQHEEAQANSKTSTAPAVSPEIEKKSKSKKDKKSED